MKKAYTVTLDKELVDEVRKKPYVGLSPLLNSLLKTHVEKNKDE